ARIARSRHGAPATGPPVDEDDVVEIVDRFETENERRIAVLLENHGGKEGCFQAMCTLVTDDTPEAPEGRSPCGLGVVRQAVEKSLYRQRSVQAGNESAFTRGEDAPRRRAESCRV